MPRIFALKYDGLNDRFETPTSWSVHFFHHQRIYLPKRCVVIDDKEKVAYLPGWLVIRKGLRDRVVPMPKMKQPRMPKRPKESRIYTDADEPPVN